MKYRMTMETPLGRLTLAAGDTALEELWLPGDMPEESFPERRTELLCRAEKELQGYFCGIRKVFDLPLAPAGTPFQRRVWQELCRIPCGEVLSYGEIARRIGQPKASRAIGQANHRNPIPILIPCHRVIAAHGGLGGYGGGLDIKIRLLEHEGVRLEVLSGTEIVKIRS